MDNLYGGFINGYLILSGSNGETQTYNISMTAAPLAIPIANANGVLDPSWQASLSVAINQYLASLSQQLYDLATNTSFSVQQMYQDFSPYVQAGAYASLTNSISSVSSSLSNSIASVSSSLYTSLTSSTVALSNSIASVSSSLSTSISSVSASLYNSITHLASGTVNPSITYAVFYVG